jgi:hypothetical protein
MLLRQVTLAQRELQLRPFVAIERLDRSFLLRNFGVGVAVNVKVDNVVIDAAENIVVRFPEVIPILPNGEIKEISAQSFHGDAAMGDFFGAHLDPRYAIMDLQIDVTFQNVEMKLYRVSVRVRPGNVEILGVAH